MGNTAPGALFPKPTRAGAAITANRFLKPGADADHVIHNAAATTAGCGVSEEDQPTTDKPLRMAFRPGEEVRVEAGGTFNANVELTSDSSGRAVAAASGNQYQAISRAASTGAGELVKCEIRYGVKA